MKILVVDDDAGLRQSLGLLLQGDGIDVAAEGNPERALTRAAEESFDIILCDVRMPGMDGIEFLRRFQASRGKALVIMMSAYGREDAAIAAMKEGAYDYLPKPFRSDEVILTLRKAEERERLRAEVASLQVELARWRDREMVAESPAMRRLVDLATRMAPHGGTVLITGESGTGKELLARTIHRLSPRRDAPFVAVNCAAIPENLLESELFGHARGAFTGATADRAGLFEEAEGGTLMLDEVGELPAALQAKLLRVLQESEYRRVGETAMRKANVRVVAATARELEKEVKAGRFRDDLYYRLNVLRLHIPPLRERPEDFDTLVGTLVTRAAERAKRTITLSPEALMVIKAHSWPGNVRELENAIERAVVLSADGTIGPDAFAAQWMTRSGAATPEDGGGSLTLSAAVDKAEREAIERALAMSDGKRNEAARLLGVSLRTFFYKLRRFRIPEE